MARPRWKTGKLAQNSVSQQMEPPFGRSTRGTTSALSKLQNLDGSLIHLQCLATVNVEKVMSSKFLKNVGNHAVGIWQKMFLTKQINAHARTNTDTHTHKIINKRMKFHPTVESYLAKSCQVLPKLTKAAISCHKLPKVAIRCHKLPEVAISCHKLPKVAISCHK